MTDLWKPQTAAPATAGTLWRRHPLDVDSAEAQIARSLAMLDAAAAGPALRWYWAQEPTLILGVFQAEDLINRAACAAHGVPVVRRRSGGTGVLAGPPLLSLDIALPLGHPLALPDVTESYHWLGAAWLAALRALGVAGARLVPIAEVRAAARPPLRRLPESGPIPDADLVHLACFGALSPYEVAVGARKLVGFSQIRRRSGVLLQVGLPLTWQAPLLAGILAVRAADGPRLEALLRTHAIGLDEVLAPVPPPATIMAAFEAVLADGWGARLAAPAD